MVECHGLARQLPGSATGGWGNDRPEPNPIGAHGNSGEGHPRVIDRIRARNGYAIPIEDTVPTGGFGFPGHRDDLMDVARGEDDSVAHVVPPERIEKPQNREDRRLDGEMPRRHGREYVKTDSSISLSSLHSVTDPSS